MHFKIAQPQNGHEIQKAHEKLDKMEYYGVIHLNWKKDLKKSSLTWPGSNAIEFGHTLDRAKVMGYQNIQLRTGPFEDLGKDTNNILTG